MKLFPLFLLLWTASFAHAARFYDVKARAEMELPELAERLSRARYVVLGEKHYSEAVQAAEGLLIREAVRAGGFEGNFTTGWEFLNFSEQSRTDALFGRLRAREIDAEAFLRETQRTASAGVYAPVIEATAGLGGSLLGVNLSREEKAPVVRGGIAALDPRLLPDGFALGSPGYFERFREAMAGHASETQIRNYYDAQCLTDDVIALRLSRDSRDAIRFLVVGSFHADYFDGAVARLKVRDPGGTTLSVRVVDASDYREAELPGLLHDVRYGDLADFAVFVNEPKD